MRNFTGFVLLLSAACFAFTTQDDAETLVMKAAQQEMPSWLAKIPVGQESYFGFTSREEFNSCSVAEPYHTITFSTDFYSDDQLDHSKNYIVILNEWRVPVTVSGENRVLLTVNEKDSAYTVNDIGGSGLARELQEKTTGNSEGHNYILRIYPMTMDILVHTSPGQSIAEGTYIPMNSALMSVKDFSSKPTFTQAEVLKLVKAKSREQGQH